MKRAALALLLTAAAPAAFAASASDHASEGGAAPQTEAPATQGAASLKSGTSVASPPPPRPDEAAVQGATPTSGDPEAGRQAEGVTVYRPEFFEASRPLTAQDMINRVPGFTLNTGSSARGFAGTAGNALIDGKRPASKSDNLSDILNRIPARQVERIEIIRGGAPGIDMQGQSIVANVVRKAGNASQQNLILRTDWFLQSGDNLPSIRYESSRTVGERTYEFSAGLGTSIDDSQGRGQRIRRDPSGAITRVETAGTEASGRPLNARGSIKTPLLGGELRSNGTISRNNFKDEDHFERPGTSISVVAKDVSTSGEVGINYTRPLTEALSLEVVGLQKLAQAEFVSNARENASRTIFTSASESGESIGRGVLRLKRSDTLSFEAGAEAAYNFRDGQTALTQAGTPVQLPNAAVLVEEARGEAFGTMTWRPFPALGVEAGSRFEVSRITASGDADNERSFFYPKPRLLLTWTPSTNDTVRVRLERQVGQLNFSDFVATANLTEGRTVAGNPELEPDKTTIAEVTYERRFWNKGALALTLAHGEITDAIDRVPFADESGKVFDAPGNIGDGAYDQVKLNLTVPLDRFGVTGGELKITDSVIKSEVTDPTTGEKRRVSGQRPEDLRVEFRHDVPQFRLTYGGTYLNGFEETYFRFNEVTRVTLDRYFAAFIDFKPNPETSFMVSLENAGRFELGRERRVFTGPRDQNPLQFVESFDTEAQQRIVLRLRRSLG
jgi:hypothetical protein